MADALWSTGSWGVADLAAGVVGPTGSLATVGDARQAFRLASVTKLFTAYACLVAVEEGTLDLDEPAGPEGGTVRHLLAHAGGYGFDTPPLSRPGRTRIYSNTGFDALGDHLAERAAMPAAEYVAAAVFEPLGLAATDLRDGSLAHGAWSTVADLSAFAAELLRPTLVAAATLAEATTVQFPGLAGALPGVGPQHPNDWGLGFELRDHKAPHWTGATNSPATFGHFGGAGTFLWVDPAIDRALVVLTDKGFGPWALDVWPRLSDQVVGVYR
ncbi:serine hydrolase domain-containing protein [Aquihabitans sp. G128]|uniref:serine hydrolase domain-containing protein n=1 Tax=Aquihabitans sp. G128 TaxID=2849779 RepID=UPI00352E2B3F